MKLSAKNLMGLALFSALFASCSTQYEEGKLRQSQSPVTYKTELDALNTPPGKGLPSVITCEIIAILDSAFQDYSVSPVFSKAPPKGKSPSSRTPKKWSARNANAMIPFLSPSDENSGKQGVSTRVGDIKDNWAEICSKG